MPRKITADDLEDLSWGAAILGTGGGGNPYRGMLMAQEALREHGPVTVLEPEELDDDDLVIPVGGIGAPTVGLERIGRGDELALAFRALERYMGRKARAVMPIEVGGGNSTGPIRTAAELGLPLVDADGMGRAFPELQQVTLTIFGITASPFALGDLYGNTTIMETIDNAWAERLARACTIQMGGSASMALFSMSGRQVKEAAVPRTLALAQQIGRALREARAAHENPVDAVLQVTGGFRLFLGKIADVDRRTATGFSRGRSRIEGMGPNQGEQLEILFQNEYLIARTEQRVLCTAPDLIMLLDAETGEPVTCEALRYGFRVAVLGIPCDARWRLPKGIELAGPGYFGYDCDYVPVEQRVRG